MTLSSTDVGSVYAPGASPFHSKGTIWMGVRTCVEECVVGGVDAVARELDPPLRDFFTQMFVSPGWYDILPVTPVADAIGRVMNVGRMEYVRQRALWQAERDMRGVYRLLLK